MPSGNLYSAPKLIELALAVHPRRVLDLGMGAGKYGYLLREQTDLADCRARGDWRLHLTGVEGWADYVGDHQHAVYDDVVVAELQSFLASYEGEPFDLALLIDVLEHLAPDEAEAAASRILSISRFLLVSTPTEFYRQEQFENRLERHRSWWPLADLRVLARRQGLEGIFGKVGHCNIALIAARGETLPQVTFNRPVRTALAYAKDTLVPELAYHRARGHAAGPRLGRA